MARLTSERGWLTVVDRIPLVAGDNPLPFGTLRVDGGCVWLGERKLATDDGAGGDVVEHAGLRYEVVKRGDALALRVRDPDSEARRTFRGLSWYPVDERWRVTASLRPYPTSRLVAYDYGDGETADLTVIGELAFELEGATWTLEPAFDGKRFLVLFGDDTNRDQTYPAGRLLYAEAARHGATVLDFNTAMNPACAFSEHVRCPLPGPRNRLRLRVEAGEKRYG